jgi:hypothetical protein
MAKPKEQKPKIVRTVISLYPAEKQILSRYADAFYDGNESAAARVIIRQFAAAIHPQPNPLPLPMEQS